MDVARVERRARRVAFLEAEELPSVGSATESRAAAVEEAVPRLFFVAAIVVVAICVGIGFMRSMLLNAREEMMGVREEKRRRLITRQKKTFQD